MPRDHFLQFAKSGTPSVTLIFLGGEVQGVAGRQPRGVRCVDFRIVCNIVVGHLFRAKVLDTCLMNS